MQKSLIEDIYPKKKKNYTEILCLAVWAYLNLFFSVLVVNFDEPLSSLR